MKENLNPLQQQFEQLAQDIVKNYSDRIRNTGMSSMRIAYIREMRAELMALKECYQELYAVQDDSFIQSIHTIKLN